MKIKNVLSISREMRIETLFKEKNNKIEMMHKKMVEKKRFFCLISPLNPHHPPGRAEVKSM